MTCPLVEPNDTDITDRRRDTVYVCDISYGKPIENCNIHQFPDICVL